MEICFGRLLPNDSIKLWWSDNFFFEPQKPNSQANRNREKNWEIFHLLDLSFYRTDIFTATFFDILPLNWYEPLELKRHVTIGITYSTIFKVVSHICLILEQPLVNWYRKKKIQFREGKKRPGTNVLWIHVKKNFTFWDTLSIFRT